MKKILILFLFSFMSIGGIFSQGDIKKGSTTVQIVEGNPNLISNNIPNAKYKQRLAYDNVNGVMWEFVGSDDGSVGQWLEAVNTKVENVSTDINLSDEFEYKKNGTSVFYNVMIAPINFNVNAGDTIIVYENGFVTNTITSGALNVNAGSLISVLKNGNTFNIVLISLEQGNINASNIDITNGTFVGQDLETVLENINTIANTPDGDGDSGNELQNLSVSGDDINISSGTGITKNQVNHWTKSGTKVYYNNEVAIGTTGFNKGEQLAVNGGKIHKTNDVNKYCVTGFNDNVPTTLNTDDVLIVPISGGGNRFSVNMKFFKNIVSGVSDISDISVNFYTFNGNLSNSRAINVIGNNPFSDIKLLYFGNNQYAIGLYGYNTASIVKIETEVCYKHLYSNSYTPAPNYVEQETNLTGGGSTLLPLTNSSAANKRFDIFGELSMETNELPESTKFAVLDTASGNVVGHRFFDPSLYSNQFEYDVVEEELTAINGEYVTANQFRSTNAQNFLYSNEIAVFDENGVIGKQTNYSKPIIITQNNHGFEIGDGLSYIRIEFDLANTASSLNLPLGYVEDVIDANTFLISNDNIIEKPAHGYDVGGKYFLQLDGTYAKTPSFGITFHAFTVIDENYLQYHLTQAFQNTPIIPNENQLTEFNVNEASALVIGFKTYSGNPVTVDWGDGQVQVVSDNTNVVHAYNSGSYTGKIRIISNKLDIEKLILGGSYVIDMQEIFNFMPNGAILDTGTEVKLYGDISNMPHSLNFFDIQEGYITGNLAENKLKNLTRLRAVDFSNISFNLADLSANMEYVGVTGKSNPYGNLADYNFPNCFHFDVKGNNTISGNLGQVNSPLARIFTISQGSGDLNEYSNGNISFESNPEIFIFTTSGEGLSTTDIDELFIDLAAFTWAGSKILILTGTHAAPSSASLSARNSLIAQGVSVSHN